MLNDLLSELQKKPLEAQMNDWTLSLTWFTIIGSLAALWGFVGWVLWGLIG